MSDPWPPRPPGDADAPRVERRPESPPPPEPTPEPPSSSAPHASRAVPEPPRRDSAPTGDAPVRRSANRRALTITALVVGAFLVVVALVGGRGATLGSPTFPPDGATTAPAGAASAATRASLASALAAQGLQIEDVLAPFRPAESPRLAAAPRIVVRAVLSADPDHGRVVIYEFLDSPSATAAAQEQAMYLKTGVALVQFPPQTRFMLRVVGSTVVFYAWSAGNSSDPAGVEAVATAVRSIGFDVPVPN